MTVLTQAHASLFEVLEPQAPDALLGLIAAFRADPRAGKLDLGVGVSRDESGATPVMQAVKTATFVRGIAPYLDKRRGFLS